VAVAIISVLTSVIVCVRVGKIKNNSGDVQVSREFEHIQSQMSNNNKMLMDSLNNTLINTNNTINNILLNQKQELDQVKKNLSDFADRSEGRIAKLTNDVNINMNSIRQENARQMSDYLNNTQNAIVSISSLQKQELENIQHRVDALTSKNEEKIEKLTQDITVSMNAIRQENEKQLDAMRVTVDEKLNVSLSQRLNESFSKIQSSLEHVDTGLGEMKALASGVGDLKKMLSNVKTRGVWGEVMLKTLLEQMLSPQQFKEQVPIKKNTKEHVDFVVIMPGRDDKEVYLPIDSKFPLEDYYRLAEASENADLVAVDKCHKQLVKRIKDEAKKINEKYIDVPTTTDFAVMFLPIEGLYAEVIKDAELIEFIQTNYKIVVCGPTTLSALLNSLQMGFKTMYIERRSSEIWGMLSTFKTEFERFVTLLLKTQNKLSDANDTIEQATKSSKKIAKKLNDVSQAVGIEYDNINQSEFDDEEESA
ncbi:MAG: DNA recombination protein RmuC, partial [Clostridia bacterium]|nr:DNA recombination protein RmuC [Clostridia bacterium]